MRQKIHERARANGGDDDEAECVAWAVEEELIYFFKIYFLKLISEIKK